MLKSALFGLLWDICNFWRSRADYLPEELAFFSRKRHMQDTGVEAGVF